MYCGHIYLKDDTRRYLLVKTPALVETATMTVLSIVSGFELHKHIARHTSITKHFVPHIDNHKLQYIFLK